MSPEKKFLIGLGFAFPIAIWLLCRLSIVRRFIARQLMKISPIYQKLLLDLETQRDAAKHRGDQAEVERCERMIQKVKEGKIV